MVKVWLYEPWQLAQGLLEVAKAEEITSRIPIVAITASRAIDAGCNFTLVFIAIFLYS